MKILLTLVCMALLCGCGPNAKQVAQAQAKQKFKDAIAAVKICNQGCSYSEFRERSLALKACYAANESNLPGVDFTYLNEAMEATDVLWRRYIQYPTLSLWPAALQSEEWYALTTINPSVEPKRKFTDEQCNKDPDFYAPNAIKLGLELTSKKCAKLLQLLDKS